MLVAIGVLILALAAAQPDARTAKQADALDLTMEQAVAIGVSRSFRLQRSRRNERIAGERVAGTKADLGPRAELIFGADQSQRYYDFRGAYDYNQRDPQFGADLTATASYDLDISGIRKRQLAQARLGRETSKIDVAQTALDVASDIRSSYVQALRAQQQVSVDMDYLGLLDSLIERARADQPGAVSFLESERSNAGLALDQSRQSADLSFSNLRQILRVTEDRPLRLTTSLQDPPQLPGRARLLSLAYENRRDLKQSEIRLEQARIARVQASDSRQPGLRASVFASQSANGDTFMLRGRNHGRTRSAGALVSFVLPIFTYDGGQLISSRNIAAIQAEQAMADAEEAKERAETEINQEMIGISGALERLKRLPDPRQARRALADAEQQMLAAGPKDAAGMLAQVTNARQNWKASVLSRIEAVTGYYTNYYRLQQTLGTELVE